jgi:primosomal protein N' (replication factor Y)
MEQGDQLLLLADLPAVRTRVKVREKKVVAPAEVNPIARVRVNVPVSHLDRDFDYLVPASIEAQCQVGDRVRVRFAGKLADAIIVDRLVESEFAKLAFIERAVGPALTAETIELVQSVAERYVGMFWDVVRAAVPNKSKAGEARKIKSIVDKAPQEHDPWARYADGSELLLRLRSGDLVRAAWCGAPASSWWQEIAALVDAIRGHDCAAGVIVLVPDALSIERLVAMIPDAEIISNHLGQGQRYRNFLEVRSGSARIVIGTRSAVFAPVHNLKAIILWDDFNDSYSDSHAPYWDAREVAALRSHETGCSLIVGGYIRSVVTASWCESGWCESIIADKPAVDIFRSHVRTLTDTAVERDPHQSRIPQLAWQAIKESLPVGPVLVSVGRRGYIPAFLCTQCGERAVCVCGGPIQCEHVDQPQGQATCGRCGSGGWKCTCGGGKIKALAIGAERTAEELGRAFAGTPVLWSQQEHVIANVDAQPRIVVATQGAEPFAENGFAAVVILDMATHSISLTASESLTRRGFAAAVRAKVGAPIVLTGDPGSRENQALARWDSPWFAGRELVDRAQAHLPPAARVALLIGDRDAVTNVASSAQEKVETRLLGPIEGDPSQVFLMVRRAQGRALTEVLNYIMRTRSADPKNSFVRIQIDPRDF